MLKTEYMDIVWWLFFLCIRLKGTSEVHIHALLILVLLKAKRGEIEFIKLMK